MQPAPIPTPSSPTPPRGLALCLLAVLSLVLLFPGAAPFIYDEPQILAEALAANARGLPAHRGLTATFPYGPAPIWLYQLLLLLTREPVTLLALRAGLFAAAIGISLFLLARATRWWRWGGLAVAASPYVWLYARQLWDASLLLPLSLAALACYAGFLRSTPPAHPPTDGAPPDGSPSTRPPTTSSPPNDSPTACPSPSAGPTPDGSPSTRPPTTSAPPEDSHTARPPPSAGPTTDDAPSTRPPTAGPPTRPPPPSTLPPSHQPPTPSAAAGGWLFAAILLSGLAVLTHLMAIPLAAGLLTHALLCRARPLLASWRAAVLGLATVGVLASSYISALVMYARYAPPGDAGLSPKPALVDAVGFLADAPRLFSARGLGYFFTEPDPRGFDSETGQGHIPYLHDAGTWSTAFNIASTLTLGAYALWAVGLVAAIWAWRRPRDATIQGDLLRAALAILAWQALMVLVTGRTFHPHYYGGVFGAHALLLWAGADRLARLRIIGARAFATAGPARDRLTRPGATLWFAGLFALHIAACLTVTLLLASRLHTTDGTRGQRFGASLATQTAAARLLATRPADAPFRNETHVIPLSVFALENLLDRPHPRPPPSPGQRDQVWILRYARPAPHATLEVVIEPPP